MFHANNINLLAFLVAAIINMVLGAIWFSPQVFGKTWSKLMGCTPAQMQKNAKKGYPLAAVGALIETWILAHYIHGQSYRFSLEFAFWMWLAFVAVTLSVGTIFGGQSWKLWKINVGYFLVMVLAQAAVLTAWR